MEQQKVSDLNEEELLQKLAASMDMLGFDTKLVAIDEYPLSIECKMPGYEELPLDMVLMFLPLDEALGDEVRIFQVYCSLYDEEIPQEKFSQFIRLFNSYNMSTPVGCYGLQEDLSLICYKYAIPIRQDQSVVSALNGMVDGTIFMAMSLDRWYDEILELAKA